MSLPPEIDPADRLGPPESDEDWLTRAEASDYLRRFGIRMKPATLARVLCVGTDGPPCEHIRNRPRYRRGPLRAWAEAQRSRAWPRRRPVWRVAP
jgi:hypothetical protein